jgi:hypothetical protein
MDNLEEANMKQIVQLKAAGPAADSLYCRPELMGAEVPYRELRTEFEHRFKDKFPENYHYT